MDLKAFKDGELLRIPVKVGNNEVSSIGKIYMVRASKADAVSRAYADVVFDVTVKVPEQPVTITADNLTMAYGDNVPSLTYKSSGGTLNGTPSLTTTATKTSPVGTYPITVTKGSATNEKATFVNGTLTITKAPLTITAKSYTIEEGKPLPTFEATYSGWKNNDTQTVLTKQPTFTCSATANSAPGTYDITVSGAEARNYEMGYAKGTLTITVPVGIGQVSADGQQEPIYDLQGRRVDAKNVRKGLYLVNGRKVVIK